VTTNILDRWRAPHALATRFLIIVLIGVVAPLGLVGIWLTTTAERSGRELLRSQLERAADALAADITARSDVREGELRLLANNSAAAAILANVASTADSLYLRQLATALAGSMTSVVLLDRDQHVRWSSDPMWDVVTRDSLQSLQAPLEDLFVERPVAVNGQRIGALAARVRLASVLSIDSVNALAPDAVLTIRDARGVIWSTAVTRPSENDPSGSNDWEVASRTAPIGSLRFELAAPVAPFVQPFERATRRGLGILLLVVLVAVAMTAFLTVRLTRSLQALSTAATAVAGGDLDRTVLVEGHDEVGALALAFNAMTESLRRTLAELSHQRSLAAVGAFAASLSHEVRNGLTAIRIDLQNAKRQLPAEHAGTILIARTLESVRRLDNMVTSALRVARSGHVTRTPERLDAILVGSVEHVRGVFDERNVILERPPCDTEIMIEADVGALEQMFVNVLLNAAQALPPGGAARIEVIATIDTATVHIADNGAGMDGGVLAALGQPFQSTKPYGTGLGLSLATRIAVEHGGSLRVASTPGAGTTVSISLPRL